jgi:hypothetical protein
VCRVVSLHCHMDGVVASGLGQGATHASHQALRSCCCPSETCHSMRTTHKIHSRNAPQVGHFPNWDVWAEWNGKYRDDVRRFIKGDAGGGLRAQLTPQHDAAHVR